MEKFPGGFPRPPFPSPPFRRLAFRPPHGTALTVGSGACGAFGAPFRVPVPFGGSFQCDSVPSPRPHPIPSPRLPPSGGPNPSGPGRWLCAREPRRGSVPTAPRLLCCRPPALSSSLRDIRTSGPLPHPPSRQPWSPSTVTHTHSISLEAPMGPLLSFIPRVSSRQYTPEAKLLETNSGKGRGWNSRRTLPSARPLVTVAAPTGRQPGRRLPPPFAVPLLPDDRSV
jgi:hypothetical protein